MPEMIFVIGANAAGKSCFIRQQFSQEKYHLLDIGEYQYRLRKEAGEMIPWEEHIRILHQAQNQILEDAVAFLKNGESVVMEHTLFMAKRRIAYLDRIRACTDAEIKVYVMLPSETVWKERLRERELENPPSPMNQLEFPNPAEGFDKIYQVTDEGICERMDEPTPEILEASRKELAEEQAAFAKKQDESKRHEQLLRSMETRKFWHYCEVCGKKEYLTADEAHRLGWDYPPKMGFFGLLSARTCGDCPMTKTLWWKVQKQGIPLVIKSSLTPEELVTWERIRHEPESLLEKEKI